MTAATPFLGMLLVAVVGPAAAPPVNVVLLMTDDMGWRDLGCQGNDRLTTPAPDRLARQGVRFTDAYSASPVCSPTRGAIITGQAPARLGITQHGKDGPAFWPKDRPVQPPAVEPVKGYVRLTRQWKPGDTIDLTLPMPVRKVLSHPAVVENRNRIALERGPIVYCIEGADSPTGQVRNLVFDPAMPVRTEFRPALLEGVQVLTFRGAVVGLDDNGNRSVLSRADVTAIPYYAWANRGQNEMAVWLPTRAEDAFVQPRPTIASESRVTASRGTGRPGAVVSGIEPKSSHDKDNEFFHWWPQKGTAEWVQFEFKEPTPLSAVEVYWLDDTGQGECKVPRSWKLMYKDGADWKQVVDGNGYATERNMYNRTAFTQVRTEAVRLEIQMQPNWSAGVLQVRFDGS